MTAGGESSPASPPERRGWRTHPLARRLPVLVLAALGLWLWRATGTPERELVWQLEGTAWSEVRAIDFQLMGADGALLEREEYFFGASGAPPELTLKLELEPGNYRALLFVRRAGHEARTNLVEPLTVGEQTYLVRRLRLPATR